MTKAAELAKMGEVITNSQIGGRRNIVINGGMQVDQRNSGSSYAQINSAYSLDRFRGNSYDGGAATGKFTVIQSSTAPDDFSHSLLVTSSAATSDAANNIFNIEQLIEGFNTAHLNYGSSSAQTITLSFYVRSSLTGTFGGALKNNARDRNYPFTYTINSANTFERKTITISGDTTGTWIGSTNGIGLWVSFGLGVGSNYVGSAGAWAAGDKFSASGATSVVGTSGATWYITGIQLEVGSQATPFEHASSFGEQLALCQRYYEKSYDVGVTPATITQSSVVTIRQSGANAVPTIFYKQNKRASATMTYYSAATGASGKARNNDGSSDVTISSLNNGMSANSVVISGSDTTYLHFHYTSDSEL